MREYCREWFLPAVEVRVLQLCKSGNGDGCSFLFPKPPNAPVIIPVETAMV